MHNPLSCFWRPLVLGAVAFVGAANLGCSADDPSQGPLLGPDQRTPTPPDGNSSPSKSDGNGVTDTGTDEGSPSDPDGAPGDGPVTIDPFAPPIASLRLGDFCREDGWCWVWPMLPTPTSISDVWVRGPKETYLASPYLGGLVHYDGTVFTPYLLPGSKTNGRPRRFDVKPDGEAYVLTDDVWILHFDGQDFTEVAQLPQSESAEATDIWAASPSAVFVTLEGVVAYFDGTKWTYPAVGNHRQLRGVWGSSASDVFAVGDGGQLWHFDGTSWTQQAIGTVKPLTDIWGRSDKEVYAVGDDGSFIYDGKTWKKARQRFSAVAGASASGGSAEAAAVGYADAWLLQGPDWQPLPSLPQLFQISGPTRVGLSSASDLTLARGRTVVRWDGSQWQTVNQQPKQEILGGFAGPSATYFVGSEGGVFASNGVQTTLLHTVSAPGGSSIPVELRGVWASSDKDIWVVGRTFGGDGIASHFDGQTWSDQKIADVPLNAVWGSAADRVFVAGYRGTIMRFDGVRWQTEDQLTESELTALWGSGPDDLWAISKDVALHYTQGSWTATTQAGGVALWGSAPTDVNILRSQSLAHYDGTTWTEFQIKEQPEFEFVNLVAGAGAWPNVFLFDGDKRVWRVSVRASHVASKQIYLDPSTPAFFQPPGEGIGLVLRDDGELFAFGRQQYVLRTTVQP